jgi:hypothetical protein
MVAGKAPVKNALGIVHLSVSDEVKLSGYHRLQSTELLAVNLPRLAGTVTA